MHVVSADSIRRKACAIQRNIRTKSAEPAVLATEVVSVTKDLKITIGTQFWATPLHHLSPILEPLSPLITRFYISNRSDLSTRTGKFAWAERTASVNKG